MVRQYLLMVRPYLSRRRAVRPSSVLGAARPRDRRHTERTNGRWPAGKRQRTVAAHAAGDKRQDQVGEHRQDVLDFPGPECQHISMIEARGQAGMQARTRERACHSSCSHSISHSSSEQIHRHLSADALLQLRQRGDGQGCGAAASLHLREPRERCDFHHPYVDGFLYQPGHSEAQDRIFSGECVASLLCSLCRFSPSL